MSVYVYYISVLRKRLSGDSIFLLLLLMSGISAQAQIHQMVRKDSSAIDRTYNLNPVVVTGSGHHQRLKSTATPVRVLSSQEISEQGITTFDGALTRMMPQASMAPNAMGTFLRLNGLGNKYILILINGQKLSGDISNNVDLNRINMARVKRIEVLDGAASSLYGSDAIAGVINIITDQPTQNLISITSDTKVSGHGIMTEAVSLDIYKNGFGSYTSFSHDQADSYQTNDEEYVKGSEPQTQKTIAPFFTGYRSNIIGQKFTYAPTQHLALNAGLDYSYKIRKPDPTSRAAPTMRCAIRACAGMWAASINLPIVTHCRPTSPSTVSAMAKSTMWKPRPTKLATMCNRRNSA